MTKTQEFKDFAAANAGKTFSATDLARELGWSKRKKKNFNTKAVVRLAKKAGAKVEEVERQDSTDRPCRGLDITL